MQIIDYFKEAAERKASDLHLVSGSVPALRINGELHRLGKEPLEANELEANIFSIVNEKIKSSLSQKKDLDFSANFAGARFRVNLHYQKGMLGMTARLIPENVPKPEEIGFDELIYSFTHLKDGLILVTGPSGSGKSTSLAAMINIINKERRAHIITIEDPIEFLFTEEQAIIEQREVGFDTESFADGLKFALRQDPNIIMVGEMRDVETVSGALTGAETGHLVLSTLHTTTAIETVTRIVNFFPAHQHQMILNQLASVLRVVVSQQILPQKGGGMVVAREIMINTRAVANLIRRGQFEQIQSIIQTSQRDGMITMNKSIDQLYNEGLIAETVARNRKRDLDTAATYY